MNDLTINYDLFESIKRIDELGFEYWLSRELMTVLGYNRWENFHKVIKSAMIACENSGCIVYDHFPEVRKMVIKMIENISEEKLQSILENIVLSGSSIGVHWIDKGQFSEVANSILETGLKNSNLGQKETFDYNDILNYFYGNYDSNGNIFTIVCAIPETIKTTEGKEYYLGMYEKFNGGVYFR